MWMEGLSKVSRVMLKRVLICGASGFIGRNLFESLKTVKNLDVWGTIFKSKPFDKKLTRVDLTSRASVFKLIRGFDYVVQAAAVTSGAKDIVNRPYIHITDNLIMNSLILEAAHLSQIPNFIFLSCTVMYPQNTGKKVGEEDCDLNKPMFGKYFGGGWMKVYCEKLCEFYSRLGNTKFTIVRHSNIYGPWDTYDAQKSHVFAATVLKVMKAKSSDTISVWGDGKDERDFLYVDDLINFIKKIIIKNKEKFEIYNVGLGKSISVGDLVKKAVILSGKNLSIEFDTSKPQIGNKLAISIAKARRELGWEPKIGLDEGILRTINWFKKNDEAR